MTTLEQARIPCTCSQRPHTQIRFGQTPPQWSPMIVIIALFACGNGERGAMVAVWWLKTVRYDVRLQVETMAAWRASRSQRPVWHPIKASRFFKKEAEPAEQGGDISDGLGIGESIFTPLKQNVWDPNDYFIRFRCLS